MYMCVCIYAAGAISYYHKYKKGCIWSDIKNFYLKTIKYNWIFDR